MSYEPGADWYTSGTAGDAAFDVQIQRHSGTDWAQTQQRPINACICRQRVTRQVLGNVEVYKSRCCGMVGLPLLYPSRASNHVGGLSMVPVPSISSCNVVKVQHYTHRSS